MKDENILNGITRCTLSPRVKQHFLNHTAARYIPLEEKETKTQIFLIFILYRDIADLQHRISFRCTAKWFGEQEIVQWFICLSLNKTNITTG